ncbi:MAG: type I methionyl aminopeptidase [Thermoplasmata archaeon]|nr:type I methionyl aminopeptidase [Thermoplasmata archaeon]
MIIIKSRREIEKMREAGRLVALLVEDLAGMAREGVPTSELDRYAERWIKEAGGRPVFKGYRGYPASICTSINEEIVHGIPRSRRKLKSGDILSIDVGIQYDGFMGDAAVTLPIGKVNGAKKKLIEVTRRALSKAVEKAVPGNRLFDISHAIQNEAESNGFSVVRAFVGHGIGTSMHEEPKIPNYGRPHTGPKLMPGMVLAIEPMINAGVYEIEVREDGWTAVTADGKPSAHFEHTVAITEEGNEILTCPQKKRQ